MADDSRRHQIPFSRWRFREAFLAPRGLPFAPCVTNCVS